MRDHVHIDEVVALTQALVSADTRNPPGNEGLAADVARQLLEPFAPTITQVEPAPGRVSLLATIGAGDGSRPTLLFNGHLDVVPVERSGWTSDPFAPAVEDGRLFGRGTADMKGGIAAVIEALHALRRAGVEPPCDIALHLVADEERGGALGTGTLAARGLIHADACVVPEPTGLAVGVAERGLLHAEITIEGRPAHASEPRRGLSAIEKAAAVVLALHGADFGDPPHRLLGTPTANVGVIDGGTTPNTVAARCRLRVDRRTLPGQTADDALASLRRRIEAIGDPELRYEIGVEVFGEASEIDPAHPWAQVVRAAVESVRGQRPPVCGMPFMTDTRFVRAAGIPAVVCGPGLLECAHAHDEWVGLDALADAATLYATLIAGFDASAAAALDQPTLATRR